MNLKETNYRTSTGKNVLFSKVQITLPTPVLTTASTAFTTPPHFNPPNSPPSTTHHLNMPEPDKRASAQQAVDILHEISTLLVCSPQTLQPHFERKSNIPPKNCQLDRRAISICVAMIERGVNPEALVVRTFESCGNW